MDLIKEANPFRPGNGHMPPHLAGRNQETDDFKHLLTQDVILQNLVITGLRGIGKTVLLESFKPLAQKQGWLWAGTDCSESVSVNEEAIALRLLTDIALLTSNVKIGDNVTYNASIKPDTSEVYLNFEFLTDLYRTTPGFVSDKLKSTMLVVWQCLQPMGVKGVVFAYDEAQTLSDHTDEKQYPLSLLLDVFSYVQKNGVPFMLILTGLPTLTTLLVNTRTYSERLFKVFVLDRLTDEASRDAILVPIAKSGHSLQFDEKSVELIVKQSGGYPYFIQFICREVFDIFEQQLSNNQTPSVPIDAIIQKLDNDFFAGRWAKATDREKQLLTLAARESYPEFSVQQLMILSGTASIKPFSGSQISQMLNRLIDAGLVYRGRRASYSFAVPLLEGYIRRCMPTEDHEREKV
jgi:hypothetical protein